MESGPCLYQFGDANPPVTTVLLPNDNPVKLEEDELETLDISSICRVCLTPSPASPLSGNHYAAFTLTTGVILDKNTLSHLCVICDALLRKCIAFRRAAREADVVLRQGVGLHLTEIHRSALTVVSKFTSVYLKPNQFDYDIVHNDTEDDETKLTIQKEDVTSKREYLNKNSAENKDILNVTENADDDCDDFDENLTDSDDEPINNLVQKHKNKTINTKQNNQLPKVAAKKVNHKKVKKKKIKKNKQVPANDIDVIDNTDPDSEIPKHQSRPATSEDGKYFEEYFTFELLCYKDQVREWEKRRESRNYLHSPFKCDYCFKGFMCDKTYNHHMSKNHIEAAGSEVCRVCHSRYPSLKALKRHSRNHIDKFCCKKCNYESNSRSAALLHMRWHREKQYNCDHCSEVFMHRSSLLSHVRLKHPSTDSVCTLCGYSFVGTNGIMCHMRRRHNNEDTTIPDDGPLCSECDIRFLNQEALEIHLQVSPKHGLMRRNSPSKIKKAKRNKLSSAAAKNLRLSKREPATCDKCGVKLSSGREYQKHFLQEHPKEKLSSYPPTTNPCLCYICGKMFRTPTVLQDHMTEHTDMQELYKCETCGKGFRKKSTLAIHRTIHLGKRYPCPLCGKMFNQVNNRDRHYTYVHSNIKDVKCDFCDKFFKSEEDKKLHISHVHFKKPYPKRDRTRKRQIDMPGVKRKRDGYMLEEETTWLRDSESSEGSMVTG